MIAGGRFDAPVIIICDREYRMSSNVAFKDPESSGASSGVSDQTRALARRLAGHMGLEAAIQISTGNQWHGVVSVLMEMKDAGHSGR